MINYLLITAIVFMSGSVIGWVTPFPLYAEIIAILFKFYQLTKKKKAISKGNAIVFAVIISAFFINLILISGAQIFWDRKTFFIDIVAIFLCATTISLEEFRRKYIDVICTISVLSLVFLILFYVGIKVGATIVDTGEAYYLMNPFFIYGWETTTSAYFMRTMRNFATFWEPGCYQAWLNYALFLHLQEYLRLEKYNLKIKRKSKRINLIKALILIITIITTKSTTGYIVLIINFAIFYSQKAKELKRKDIFMILAGLIGVTVVLNTSTIVNKFTGDSSSYISFVRRATDQIGGIKAAMYSPVWGLGMYSPLYYEVMKINGINGNSSGFLRLLQETGLPFGLWFTYAQLKNTIKQYVYLHKRILTNLLICFMFLILFSTEPINYTGVFFMLVYRMKTEKKVMIV